MNILSTNVQKLTDFVQLFYFVKNDISKSHKF